jgi:WD40 repeat protein
MYFSPDGRYLVLGSSDRSVRVWDWKNNKEIRILEGHTKSLDNAYVCFSPDGRYIASLASGTARIWDWENNNEIRRLKIDSLEVSCSVCFSPDRKYIAFSDHTDIRIWDWENQKEMRIKEMQRLKPYEYASYRHVCFSPDGRYIIASGSRDMTLYVWDLKNLKEVQSPIISLNAEENIRVFSNNSRQIVGTGSSGQILIYDIENLTTGIAIVTALRDLNNHLSVRCKYCGQVFDIPEDKSGKTVKCPHCNEELQINDFTADPIIIEDKSIEVETDKFNIPNENSNDPGNIAENNNYNINYNVLYTEVIDRSERLYSLRRRFYVLLGRLRRHPGKLPTQKKKGFFSRLFGRNS